MRPGRAQQAKIPVPPNALTSFCMCFSPRANPLSDYSFLRRFLVWPSLGRDVVGRCGKSLLWWGLQRAASWCDSIGAVRGSRVALLKSLRLGGVQSTRCSDPDKAVYKRIEPGVSVIFCEGSFWGPYSSLSSIKVYRRRKEVSGLGLGGCATFTHRSQRQRISQRSRKELRWPSWFMAPGPGPGSGNRAWVQIPLLTFVFFFFFLSSSPSYGKVGGCAACGLT